MASATATSFSNSRLYDDMIENDDGLYCPDFTMTRRPVKHTTSRYTGWNTYEQPIVTITRPGDKYPLVPVTEIDDVIGMSYFSHTDIDVSLGKNDMFDTVQDALDTYATSMVKTFDVYTNIEKRTYTVPIIGYIDIRSTVIDDIDCDYFHTGRYNWKKYHSSHGNTSRINTHDDNAPRERFIIIDGDTYSTLKKYKRHGSKYVALNIPFDIQSDHVDENEHYFRIAKFSPNKSSITVTLPKETILTGFTLEPEKMIFEQIHSTAIRCGHHCSKQKHHISCLKNDPGFVITFKLFIRSSLTDGQWLSLGTFSGNNSMYDSTRIVFENIAVKEFRIVPTNYHKSYDKIRITPIGPSISSTTASDEEFVTYILEIPRDDKYRSRFDKVVDKYRGHNGCTCGICMPYSKCKGSYKERCQFMRDACDM